MHVNSTGQALVLCMQQNSKYRHECRRRLLELVDNYFTVNVHAGLPWSCSFPRSTYLAVEHCRVVFDALSSVDLGVHWVAW